MTLKHRAKFIHPRIDEIRDEATREVVMDLMHQLGDLWPNVYDDLKNNGLRENDFDNFLFKLYGYLWQQSGYELWDDQQVNLASSVFKGSSDPTWTAYKGAEVLAFDKAQDNIIYFTMQMSHKLKLATDIEFHLHNTVPSAGAGVVRWVMTASFIDIGGDFPAQSTYTADQTVAANSDDLHMLHEMASSLGQGSGVSGLALCSLMREGTHANDTFDDDVYLLAMDSHFQIDSIGSRQETVK